MRLIVFCSSSFPHGAYLLSWRNYSTMKAFLILHSSVRGACLLWWVERKPKECERDTAVCRLALSLFSYSSNVTKKCLSEYPELFSVVIFHGWGHMLGCVLGETTRRPWRPGWSKDSRAYSAGDKTTTKVGVNINHIGDYLELVHHRWEFDAWTWSEFHCS